MAAMNCQQFKHLFSVLVLIVVFPALYRESVSQHISLGREDADEHEAKEVMAEAKQLVSDWSDQSVSDAITLYFKAAAMWGKLRRSSEEADSLRATGELMLWQNRGPDSESTLNRALRLEPEPQNLEGRGKTLYLLAMVALKDNDLKAAAKYSKLTMEIADKSKSNVMIGLAHLVKGEIAYRRRDIAAMIDTQERALEYFTNARDQENEAQTLTFLSYSYVMKNDRSKGIEFAERSIEIQRRLANRRGLAFALVAYGDANQRVGELKKAKNAFDEAEKLFPAKLDLGEKASLFTKIGMYYETLGDLETATEYFENAQRDFKSSGNLFGSAELLTVIGQDSLRLGNADKAIEYFTRGLDQSRKLRDSWSLGMVNERIGDAFYQKGDLASAESYYQRALSFIERTNSIAFRKASVKRSLGILYEKRKEYPRALDQFMSSLQLSIRIQDRAATSETLICIATLYAAKGQTGVALETASKAIQITDNLDVQIDNSQLKATYFSSVYNRYELIINLLMRMAEEKSDEGFSVQALQASEKARARSLLETMQLSVANFTRDAPPQMVQREKQLSNDLNTKRNRLTELLSANAGKDEEKTAEGEAREVERELEDVKAELKQTSPIYSAIRNPAQFDVQKFQQEVLDGDTVFLEFSLGEKDSYLWVIGRKEVTHYVLPPRERLEAQIGDLLELLRAREQKPDESIETYNARVNDSEQRYPVVASDLSRELLGPAAEKIKGKRLIVSPDGKIAYLPLSALPSPNSETGEPLVVTNEIIYSPSASILSLLKGIELRPRIEPTKNLLVFADPVFAASDERLGGNKLDQGVFQTSFAMMRSAESIKDLARLPASQTEATSVSAIATNSTVVTGFAANRDRVLNSDLADYKVIHFATHGIFNEENPDLSGILLSLYDERGATSEGFIRAADIYGMNLNADMIVLSSCNSGVGKEVRGEGMIGLNAAFLQAGSHSVVSSLWKVDDNATEILMREFYGAMADGSSTPAQALRKAQLSMMHDVRYRSPFYWAAFTMHGDPDVRVTFSSSRHLYLAMIIGLGVIGALLFLSLWQVRRTKVPHSTSKA